MSLPVRSLYNLTEISPGVYTFINFQGITFKFTFQVAVSDDGFLDKPKILEKLLIVTFRPFPKIDISSINDERISYTICHYIQKALDNGYIINYLCSDENGLGRVRRIIFGRWFYEFPEKEMYHKIDYTLEESNGTKTYLGFIIKQNNLLFSDFIEAVDAEVEMYQSMKED